MPQVLERFVAGRTCEALKEGDHVRCRLNGYQGLRGTIDELETAHGGLPAAWIRWDIPDHPRAVTGCFFLLFDLEKVQ